jgi:hypothetical protein
MFQSAEDVQPFPNESVSRTKYGVFVPRSIDRTHIVLFSRFESRKMRD